MSSFLLIINGDLKAADLALTKIGLDGFDAKEHPGRVTCHVKGPPRINDILNGWLLETKDTEKTRPEGALLWFKAML